MEKHDLIEDGFTEYNKYELIKDDFTEYNGIRCYRIRALRDFGNVKAGDLGGYVSRDGLISHVGECWVDKDSVACEANNWCEILGDAQIVDSVICDTVVRNSKVCNSTLFDCDIQQSTIITHCILYGIEARYSNLTRIADFTRALFGLRFRDFHFGFDDFEKSMIFKTQKGRKILFYQDMDGVIRVVAGCKTGITLKEFKKDIYSKDVIGFYDKYKSYKDLPLHRKEYLEMIKCVKRICQLRKED